MPPLIYKGYIFMTITAKQAKTLAVSYAAYVSADPYDYLTISFFGTRLLEVLEQTGVHLHDPELIKQRVAHADRQLDHQELTA
jgi:hypothetical protein